jgi:hypothetical protein
LKEGLGHEKKGSKGGQFIYMSAIGLIHLLEKTNFPEKIHDVQTHFDAAHYTLWGPVQHKLGL